MNILNNGRFGMGACLTGTMRMLISKATDHANNRKQFVSNLREYQGIQQKIAKMNLLCYANEVRGTLLHYFVIRCHYMWRRLVKSKKRINLRFVLPYP